MEIDLGHLSQYLALLAGAGVLYVSVAAFFSSSVIPDDDDEYDGDDVR